MFLNKRESSQHPVMLYVKGDEMTGDFCSNAVDYQMFDSYSLGSFTDLHFFLHICIIIRSAEIFLNSIFDSHNLSVYINIDSLVFSLKYSVVLK